MNVYSNARFSARCCLPGWNTHPVFQHLRARCPSSRTDLSDTRDDIIWFVVVVEIDTTMTVWLLASFRFDTAVSLQVAGNWVRSVLELWFVRVCVPANLFSNAVWTYARRCLLSCCILGMFYREISRGSQRGGALPLPRQVGAGGDSQRHRGPYAWSLGARIPHCCRVTFGTKLG